MSNYLHKKLPDFSTLLSGHSPKDEWGFKSNKLQIWYNNTDKSWVGDGETPHKHLDSDECFIVLQGTLTVSVEGEQIEIKPGEYSFFPSGVFHNILSVQTPAETLIIRSPSTGDKVYQDHGEEKSRS
jgi:mannose-6-phosphate isomerase-like protein (cupin superfamily)